MTTVGEVVRWLDDFAPPRLAEPWDNVGLLWGDPRTEVARVMTCLTVTPATAREAIEEGAGLIVSHHPVLFKPVKRVRADRPETAPLWELARAGIGIASPHTAFDNAPGGVNDGLARRLGLIDVGPLRPSAGAEACKLVVFAPRTDREAVLDAAFRAGAGRIGEYEECSFSIPGVGTFFGTESTNPTVGRPGRRELVRELRLEILCPADQVDRVVRAIREQHSYEEPAIDVYPLRPPAAGLGSGRVGRLPEPLTLARFAEQVSAALPTAGVQLVGDDAREVSRVAIACGAGDDFVPDAAGARADVLLTGEARFHRALEAEALGLGLVLAGHYATERPGVEDLAGRLAEAFTGLLAWPSRREADPLRWAAPAAQA